MNISSETVADLYCEPQFNRMHLMIPGVQRQHGMLLIRADHQNEITSGSGYIPRNINNANNQQASSINLHGNANTNVKILNKKAAENNDDDENKNDNPIDLSSTAKHTIQNIQNIQKIQNIQNIQNIQSTIQENNLQVTNKDTEDIRSPRKIIKRKISNCNIRVAVNEEDLIINSNNRNIESWVGHVKPVPGIPRQAGSKREEVLKAARSLFSKRTRTLYHWLCPTTSKTKLKSTVAAAWDTLSSAEKDFYISQVLGRFGVPACSLMVNPQLGGLKTDDKQGNINSSAGPSSNMEETNRAVCNLLLNENDPTWTSYSQSDEIPRKKRKNNFIYKPETTAETPNNKELQKQPEEEETRLLKEIREASMEDDFADDPELNTEFEQFRKLIDDDLAKYDFNDVLDGI